MRIRLPVIQISGQANEFISECCICNVQILTRMFLTIIPIASELVDLGMPENDCGRPKNRAPDEQGKIGHKKRQQH